MSYLLYQVSYYLCSSTSFYASISYLKFKFAVKFRNKASAFRNLRVQPAVFCSSSKSFSSLPTEGCNRSEQIVLKSLAGKAVELLPRYPGGAAVTVRPQDLFSLDHQLLATLQLMVRHILGYSLNAFHFISSSFHFIQFHL